MILVLADNLTVGSGGRRAKGRMARVITFIWDVNG